MWVLGMLLACGGGQPAPPSTHVSTDHVALHGADEADGTVDKVVSQCAVCALGMEGSPLHAVQHDGYELHFCSASCKDTFSDEPVAVLERL